MRQAGVHEGEASNLAAEQRRKGVGNPGPHIVGGQKVAVDPNLLQQAMHGHCQGLSVVAAGRAVRIALPGQIRRDHPVSRSEQRHDLAPCIPAFRKTGEQDDDLSIRLTPADIVQPDAVDCAEGVLEAMQAGIGPTRWRGFDHPDSARASWQPVVCGHACNSDSSVMKQISAITGSSSPTSMVRGQPPSAKLHPPRAEPMAPPTKNVAM